MHTFYCGTAGIKILVHTEYSHQHSWIDHNFVTIHENNSKLYLWILNLHVYSLLQKQRYSNKCHKKFPPALEYCPLNRGVRPFTDLEKEFVPLDDFGGHLERPVI